MLDHDKRKHLFKQIKWLIVWISAAIVFNVGVFVVEGEIRAQEFLAGYLTELSLSIDNVFVFLMIFRSFGISEHAQHRVLAWGIIGAVILRFLFVFFGIALITTFEWIVWIFGAFLIGSVMMQMGARRIWINEKMECDLSASCIFPHHSSHAL